MAEARYNSDDDTPPKPEGYDDEPVWEDPAPADGGASSDPIDHLAAAGKAATDAAVRAVRSIDFDAIGSSLNKAVADVADAIAPKGPQKSPYIIEEKGARGRGVLKVVAGAWLLFVGVPLALAGIFSFTTGGIFGLAGGGGIAYGGYCLVKDGLEGTQVARTLEAVSRAAGLRAAVRVDELAGKVGIAAPKLKKQLRRGVEKGLLPQGRLVKVNGHDTLYLTKEAYQADKNAANAAKARANAAKAKKRAEVAEDAADAKLPADARRVIDACEGFEAVVRRVAPDLLDSRMRESAFALAAKAAKIADRVRKDPDAAASLDRYASYYLPTAGRMLESAAELDREGAQGANAKKTRSEVGSTLEMLCDASDKLLDDLLEEKTWDVSSDAGVMRTLLKQDGLTDDDGLAAAAADDAATTTKG